MVRQMLNLKPSSSPHYIPKMFGVGLILARATEPSPQMDHILAEAQMYLLILDQKLRNENLSPPKYPSVEALQKESNLTG